MIARLRLQPADVGMGLTGQRVRDRLIEDLRAGGIADECVLNAIRTVPRHQFVDEALASAAEAAWWKARRWRTPVSPSRCPAPAERRACRWAISASGASASSTSSP